MRAKWYRRSLIVPLIALLTAVACGTGSTQSAGSVKVIGVWSGQEQLNFLAVVKPFEDSTGIKVNFESSRDEDAILTTRVGAGNPPDLAAAPSPQLLTTAGEHRGQLDQARRAAGRWQALPDLLVGGRQGVDLV